jgi:uncharacterized protein (TIGR02246 family)
MFKSIASLATVILFAALAAAADTLDDVDAAVEAWADAYNSHDPARVAARYHREAAFWGTTSPTLRTTPADVVSYFASLERRPNAEVRIDDKRIRVTGSVAIVTGSYTFTDVVDGSPVTRPSRFSFVLEHAGDEWLIVQHHSSRMPN